MPCQPGDMILWSDPSVKSCPELFFLSFSRELASTLDIFLSKRSGCVQEWHLAFHGITLLALLLGHVLLTCVCLFAFGRVCSIKMHTWLGYPLPRGFRRFQGFRFAPKSCVLRKPVANIHI